MTTEDMMRYEVRITTCVWVIEKENFKAAALENLDDLLFDKHNDDLFEVELTGKEEEL